MENTFHLGDVLEVILAGVGLAVIMGIVGMIVWFIKVKPQIEGIKIEMAKKAAADELQRINADLKYKEQEAQRIKEMINGKQDKSDCDLLRKGCQPLFFAQLKNVADDVKDLKCEYQLLSAKLERWMEKNGTHQN